MPNASWVIVSRETGKAVFETFNRALAGKINTARYEAVPIRVYLAGLNTPGRSADV